MGFIGRIARAVPLKVDQSVVPIKMLSRKLPIAVKQDVQSVVQSEVNRLKRIGVSEHIAVPTASLGIGSGTRG